MKLAYLGPRGTFSCHAVELIFGDEHLHVPCGSFDEVFESVERQENDLGVIPLENSAAGIVGSTQDLLFRSSLKIIAEAFVPIVHSLVSTRDSLEGAKTIYSFPQPYQQSKQFIETFLPGLRYIQASSSADALRLTRDDSESVAIGLASSARNLGLRILREGIQDDDDNSTRFVVLSASEKKNNPFLELPPKRATLVFTLKDEPGSLLKILQIFDRHRLNLCHIESRPTRKDKWKYFFGLSVDCPNGTKGLESAILEVESAADWCRVIGIYPTLNL